MAGKPSAAERIDGATDRLSPMLVKELRQGMKARAFGLAFLLMQGLMVFTVILSAAADPHSRSTSQEISKVIFWICVGTPLLIIMPARSLGGLQQEYRANTLELLFLTRLSAWRIVAGKWIALFSQILLLASGILPYLLLRYFFGGINVADDVQVFLYLLIASGLLCAGGLCLSSYRNPAVRIFALLGIFCTPFIVGMVASAVRVSHYSRSTRVFSPSVVTVFGLILAGAALLALLLLAWAADRIAPPARRHTGAKRLLTFALVGLFGFLVHYTREDGWMTFALVLSLPICLDALSEPLQAIPSLYARFARRGRLARLLNFVLTPGWAPAAVFTMLLTALLAAFSLDYTGGSSQPLALMLAFYGALLGPLALVQAFRPNTGRLPGLYLLSQLFLVVIGSVLFGVHAFRPQPLEYLCWIPTASLLFALLEPARAESGLIALAAMDAVVTGLLLFRLGGAFARIRAWETESLNTAPQAG